MTPQEWGYLHNAQQSAAAGASGAQKTDPNQFLGGNFNNLQEMLTKLFKSGDPNKDQYRQLFEKQLGKQTSGTVRNIKEQMSASGFKGAGANLLGDVYETGANATQGFENDLLQRDTQIEQNALAQLLGLNQFEGNQKLNAFQSDRSNQQFNQSLLMNQLMQQQQFEFQKDQSGTGFWDVLGGVLGAGAGALGGGYLGALGSKWA